MLNTLKGNGFYCLLTLVSIKMEHRRPLQVCTNVCIIFADTGAGVIRGTQNPKFSFKCCLLWYYLGSRPQKMLTVTLKRAILFIYTLLKVAPETKFVPYFFLLKIKRNSKELTIFFYQKPFCPILENKIKNLTNFNL